MFFKNYARILFSFSLFDGFAVIPIIMQGSYGIFKKVKKGNLDQIEERMRGQNMKNVHKKICTCTIFCAQNF